MGGAAITRLTINKINEITIPLPPLPLQQKFASKIETIERQKELIKQSIKEVETLFNSRMDYYFN
jgi:type I restriction enzyme S subunit